MPIEKSGKLEKLKIEAYDNDNRSGNIIGTFEVMFNPNSVTMQHQTIYEGDPGLGNSTHKAKYKYSLIVSAPI